MLIKVAPKRSQRSVYLKEIFLMQPKKLPNIQATFKRKCVTKKLDPRFYKYHKVLTYKGGQRVCAFKHFKLGCYTRLEQYVIDNIESKHRQQIHPSIISSCNQITINNQVILMPDHCRQIHHVITLSLTTTAKDGGN